MMKDEFKSLSKTKIWSFGFYFLLLVSYNNVHYTYESFFIHIFINWN
jgi:hypothetical protein